MSGVSHGDDVRSAPKNPVVEIRAEYLLDLETWNVELLIDGGWVGGATTPRYPIDSAAEILYGDKNDWLNNSHGVLGDYMKERGLDVR